MKKITIIFLALAATSLAQAKNNLSPTDIYFQIRGVSSLVLSGESNCPNIVPEIMESKLLNEAEEDAMAKAEVLCQAYGTATKINHKGLKTSCTDASSSFLPISVATVNVSNEFLFKCKEL